MLIYPTINIHHTQECTALTHAINLAAGPKIFQAMAAETEDAEVLSLQLILPSIHLCIPNVPYIPHTACRRKMSSRKRATS